MSFVRFVGLRFVSMHKHVFSKAVINVAIIAIALSTAVIIVSTSIVKGFQNEIHQKVHGFSGHIRLLPYQFSYQQQQIPIEFNDSLLILIQQFNEVKWIQPSTEKAGIIKTEDQMEGCILKGLSTYRNEDFFRKYLKEGAVPSFATDTISNEVLVSKAIVNRLRLNVGDNLFMFFLTEGETRPRARKFQIAGTYETGLTEFDKKYIFGDIRHVQRLNGWNDKQVGVVEIFLHNPKYINVIVDELVEIVDVNIDVWDVRLLYPEIFNWLKLLDMNVIIITIIMLFVALMNVLTIMLIRILEKTHAIGILKSIGATNNEIRKMFIIVSSALLVRGMIWGNLVGFTLLLIQHNFGIIQLNQEMYYVSIVPVFFNWKIFFSINFLIFISGILSMIVPSFVISKILPAHTLRLT